MHIRRTKYRGIEIWLVHIATEAGWMAKYKGKLIGDYVHFEKKDLPLSDGFKKETFELLEKQARHAIDKTWKNI